MPTTSNDPTAISEQRTSFQEYFGRRYVSKNLRMFQQTIEDPASTSFDKGFAAAKLARSSLGLSPQERENIFNLIEPHISSHGDAMAAGGIATATLAISTCRINRSAFAAKCIDHVLGPKERAEEAINGLGELVRSDEQIDGVILRAAVSALIPLANHKDSDLRNQAIHALGKIAIIHESRDGYRREEVVGQLKRALHDEDAFVRRAAGIRYLPAFALMLEDPRARKSVEDALNKWRQKFPHDYEERPAGGFFKNLIHNFLGY